MRVSLKYLVPVLLVALVVVAVGVLFPTWQAAVERNGDARAEAHQIAGNLYFVGSPDIAAFLVTGPDGHALIGSSHRGRAHKILDNIQKLGFAARDVKLLLATDPHGDEAGGLAELQQATGAEVVASDANAHVLAHGGHDDPSVVYGPFRFMTHLGVPDFTYDPPRTPRRVKDEETVRLGALAFTAHITPGHAPGCTTWTFTVRDRNRDLRVVHRCGLGVPYRASLVEPESYPGIRADFERSFAVLRGLPVDIWIASHGIEYGRYRKYQASLSVGPDGDRAAPFIDPAGYRQSIDDAEAKFRAVLAEQQGGP